MVDENDETAPAAPTTVPRPYYDAMAPSDWVGSEAVVVMLEDLDFPQKAGPLKDRVGNWLVPVRGTEGTVPLGRLLADVPDDRRFANPRDVAREIRRHYHGF